ncbi:hypothetical protein E2C01_017425 [Portunus trituberculatus]|uniref:Uncharacterized protein n=1 Tax=Portunus trituberculatus TaxID=210409 RepID=A0A5B7DTE9_PORTR|nr:hypothetical protein [Portunus trituberculatus]
MEQPETMLPNLFSSQQNKTILGTFDHGICNAISGSILKHVWLALSHALSERSKSADIHIHKALTFNLSREQKDLTLTNSNENTSPCSTEMSMVGAGSYHLPGTLRELSLTAKLLGLNFDLRNVGQRTAMSHHGHQPRPISCF